MESVHLGKKHENRVEKLLLMRSSTRGWWPRRMCQTGSSRTFLHGIISNHSGEVHWLVLKPAKLPFPKFPPEKEVWYHHHQQEANPDEDRISGTFVDGTNCPAGCAGVRRHPDGHEVDGVFTLEEFRGRGACPARRAGMKSTPAGMKSCTCASTLCN